MVFYRVNLALSVSSNAFVSPDSLCFTPSSCRTQTSGTCRTTSARSSTVGGSQLKSPSWWRWRVGEWRRRNKEPVELSWKSVLQVYFTGCQIHTCMTEHTCMQEELLKMCLMPSYLVVRKGKKQSNIIYICKNLFFFRFG